MSRRIVALVVLLMAFLGVGFLLTFIQKLRFDAHVLASQNNLRQLALFAAHRADANASPQGVKLLHEIPAATIVLPDVAPDDRLSWIVAILPSLDRVKNPVEKLIAAIDVQQPWSAQRNRMAGQMTLPVVLCPENTPQTPADGPAITCYAGIAGLGRDAATIAIPATGPTPARAGAFRYDAATPFARIADGLSQTLLLAETNDNPGPWLEGGPSTSRGLDDSMEAKPLIGTGGQFGGFFPNGAHFALCDGSVRLFTPQTTPAILFNMATIAGGEKEMMLE
jgi:hypothetical protein